MGGCSPWRGGEYPAWYEDSLPALGDIGLARPVGVDGALCSAKPFHEVKASREEPTPY